MTTKEKIAAHFRVDRSCVWKGVGKDESGRPRRGWFVKKGDRECYLGISLHEVQSSPNWVLCSNHRQKFYSRVVLACELVAGSEIDASRILYGFLDRVVTLAKESGVALTITDVEAT